MSVHLGSFHLLNPLPLEFSMHHEFHDFRQEHLVSGLNVRPFSEQAHYIFTRGACGAIRPWRPAQNGGEPRAPSDDATPTTLDALWRAKPIRRLMLICVRNTDGGVDVTVHVNSRKAPSKDPMLLAHAEAFHSTDASKASVVAHAVRILSEWSDGDFADAAR
jgi:hypothetical protein